MNRANTFLTELHSFPLQDGLIIAHEGSHRLFVLNATGRLMWDLCQRGLDHDAIVRQVAVYHRVPLEAVRSHVRAMLGEWRKQGLLGSDGDTPLENEIVPVERHDIPQVEWIHQRAYRLWGKTFSIRTTEQDIANLIYPLVSNMEIRTDARPDTTISVWKDRSRYIIASASEVLSTETRASDALTSILQTMVRHGLPALDLVAVLHASAVGDDRIAVLAGEAGSGKSTLTAGLARSGFTYWGDDSVPLDTDLNAVAMPVGICLKSGSWPALASLYPELERLPVYPRFGQDVRYLFPGNFAGDREPRRSPAACLVFPRYQQEHDATLEAISPLDAIQRLVEAGAWVSFAPARLSLLVEWVRRTPAYALSYDSLEGAMPLVRQSLGT